MPHDDLELDRRDAEPAWQRDLRVRDVATKLADVRAYVDEIAGDNEGRRTQVLMDLLRLSRTWN